MLTQLVHVPDNIWTHRHTHASKLLVINNLLQHAQSHAVMNESVWFKPASVLCAICLCVPHNLQPMAPHSSVQSTACVLALTNQHVAVATRAIYTSPHPELHASGPTDPFAACAQACSAQAPLPQTILSGSLDCLKPPRLLINVVLIKGVLHCRLMSMPSSTPSIRTSLISSLVVEYLVADY